MSNRKLPEIRIKDAWLLRENASQYLHELWGKGKTLADDKWMEKRVAYYQAAWKPYEKKILTGMCDTMDLTFRQNIIDVYVAPWFFAFSDPLVIGVTQDPDLFIDTLTHELIHRLFTDSTAIPYQENILMPEWQKLYGKEHNFSTLVHIPVHALHQAIMVDVLQEPERFEREMSNLATADYDTSNYVNAWKYVEKHGYQKIVKELKDSYKKLGAKYD